MMKTCLALLCIPFLISTAKAQFIRLGNIEDARITRVTASLKNPRFLAVTSDDALYISRDKGITFRKTFGLKDETVAHLLVDNRRPDTLYLAGTRNCYRVDHQTTRIFTANEDEQVHSIASHNGVLYIATSAGLYYSEDTILEWKTVPGLKHVEVYSIEVFGSRLYLAGSSGVYLFHPEQHTLRRIFTTRSDAVADGLKVYLVKVDLLTPSRLWLCTNKGLYRSDDRGTSWKKNYIEGADRVAVYCMAQPPLTDNIVYLSTAAGLFKTNPESGTSTALYEGLPTPNVRWITFTPSGTLLLATDRGLFQQQKSTPRPTTPVTLRQMMEGEPSIQQAQSAALHYNSVHPDKVGRWRRHLKYRALLPKISVDYDSNIGSSFTKDAYYYAHGPNEWGISVSWDMGNLLWNNYEDDVDNRNKLTTQLRMDILDEVNRLYFERLRLKRELLEAEAGTETLQSELRFQELTAALDGYTGGLFSQSIP